MILSVQRVVYLFICSLLVLLPNTSVLEIFWPYDEKRLWLVIITLMAVLGVCIGRGRTIFGVCKVISPFHNICFVALFACIGLSIFYSFSPMHALIEVGGIWSVIIISVFVSDIYIRDKKKVFGILSFALLASTFWYFFSYLVAYFWEYLLSPRVDFEAIFHGFFNKRFLNQFQVWAIPIMSWGVIYLKVPRLNSVPSLIPAIFYFSIIGSWALLFLSYGRGAGLSIVISMTFVFCVLKLGTKDYLKLHIKCMAIGFCGALILFSVGVGGETEAFRTGLSGRGELWLDAWRMWLDSPFLGVGPMHYAHYTSNLVSHPHNAYIQIIVEYGVIVFILMCVLFVPVVKAWWNVVIVSYKKTCSHDHDFGEKMDLLAALVIAAFGAAIYANFSGVIVMPMSLLLMGCVVGFMSGEFMLQVGNTGLVKHNLQLAMAKLLIGGITVTLCLVTLSAFNDRQLENKSEPWSPRFWLSGKF